MLGGIITRILVVLLAAAWFAAATPAAAQAGLAGEPLGLCIARVAPGDTAAALMRQPARFDCATAQRDHGPGDYWALSGPLPASAAGIAGGARVRVSSVNQSALTLNILYADGRIVALPTTSATIGRRIQLGAIVEFAIPERAAPPVRLLWRVDGSVNLRGIVLGQRIAAPVESVRANLTMAAIYAGFGALAFGLLVYNIALWGALRHRFQLAYCAMIVVLLAFALTSSGLIAWVTPGLDNNDRIRLNYMLLGLAGASAIAFARTFFEPRVFAGWLGPATWGAAALMVLSGLVFGIGSRLGIRIADPVASAMFLTALAITVPILWNAWARGSRFLIVFALAWAMPIVFAGARILASLNLFAAGFWLDNSTVLSLAFEALMSSLAIAYRVQMLSRERDQALAGEVQARALADTDPLTGLLNRRAFLDRAIGSPRRRLLHLIDIDHFKQVNETLGHDGGDEVLRVFARTLRSAVPGGGLIARLGGEEFAVLVDADDADDPPDADALLNSLRKARMPFDLRVTASIGSCTGALATEIDWKMMYRQADRALYDAKDAGRDRSRSAGPLAIAA